MKDATGIKKTKEHGPHVIDLDDLAKRIIYEDNHLIVVNKRPGELSQGDKTGDTCLIDALKELRKIREAKPGDAFVGLVHRIDRPTSGIVVCAKTSKALARLSASFQGRDVEKVYQAVIDGPMPSPEGRMLHYLVRTSSTNKSRAYDEPGPDRQEAISTWRVIGAGDRYHLVEISIETGRHHQIRAQLQALGIHIKGDLKYGAKRSNPDGGICLHAARIKIPHPVGGTVLTIEADPVQVQEGSIWKLFSPGTLENSSAT